MREVIHIKSRSFQNVRASIKEKVSEAIQSVLPIFIIVALLCLTLCPVTPDLMLSFLVGTLLVVVGMGLFSLGAEQSMTPIGVKIGTALTKSKNLPLILIASFLLGFAVTVAEPDLQVLAETVPHIHNTVLLFTVGAGVGFFLVVGMLRILTGKKLRIFLLIFYGIVFLLASFTDQNFLGIAFDAGGVTTGPMTVPFILALGVGTYYDLPAADFFSVESTFITSGMVQQIHLRGKTVSAWTVNRTEDARALLSLGVDDVITDKPEMVQDLLNEDADLDRNLVLMRDRLKELLGLTESADSEVDPDDSAIEEVLEDPEELLDQA